MPGIRIDCRESNPVGLDGGNRELRVILDGESLPEAAVALARYQFKPMVTGPRHRHEVETEVYYCLEGSGTVIVGEIVYHINPGVTVCIPPKNDHQTSSGEEGLVFLAFFSPPVKF